MSARLVSRKPRPYASFVAVSVSRVRLSGCAVRIFSDSKEVSYLTNSDHKPLRSCCQGEQLERMAQSDGHASGIVKPVIWLQENFHKPIYLTIIAVQTNIHPSVPNHT